MTTSPTLTVTNLMPAGANNWVEVLDYIVITSPISGNATTYVGQFAGYTYTITGTALTYTNIGNMDFLSGGTITGFSVESGGQTILTGTNLTIDAGDLYNLIQAENAGDIDAIENVFYALNWTFVDSGNSGGLAPGSTNLDGIPVKFTGDNTVYLNGGSQDVFDLGAGDDTAYGGAGSDYVLGGKGKDTILGGDGSDYLSGDAGNDVLKGGKGRDMIAGGKGNDVIRAGNQADQANGGAGNDNITGGKGGDILWGGTGADLIKGNNGIDALLGEDGADILRGGDETDVLFAGNGRDTLNGGSGADYFAFFADDDANTIEDFQDGTDFIVWEGDLAYTETDTANGLLLSYAGGSALLVGMTAADFDADDVVSEAEATALFATLFN